MKLKKLTVYCLALFCASSSLYAQSGEEVQKKRSGNPIFPGWYADPEGVVLDGKFWIYPTYSAPYDEQTFMDAYSSPDLVHWTKHPRVLSKENIPWLRRALWAPAVIEANDRYYLSSEGTIYRTTLRLAVSVWLWQTIRQVLSKMCWASP